MAGWSTVLWCPNCLFSLEHVCFSNSSSKDCDMKWGTYLEEVLQGFNGKTHDVTEIVPSLSAKALGSPWAHPSHVYSSRSQVSLHTLWSDLLPHPPFLLPPLNVTSQGARQSGRVTALSGEED